MSLRSWRKARKAGARSTVASNSAVYFREGGVHVPKCSSGARGVTKDLRSRPRPVPRLAVTLRVWKCPLESNYLFLSDHADRGKQNLETIILFFAYKTKDPGHIFLLKGNHEYASITLLSGFYEKCKRRYNIKLWKEFCEVLTWFSLSVKLQMMKLACMAVSRETANFKQVRRLVRPTDVLDKGLICGLLWADPVTKWAESDRDVSFLFGPDVKTSRLQKHDMELVCRAQSVVEDGCVRVLCALNQRDMVIVNHRERDCARVDMGGDANKCSRLSLTNLFMTLSTIAVHEKQP